MNEVETVDALSRAFRLNDLVQAEARRAFVFPDRIEPGNPGQWLKEERLAADCRKLAGLLPYPICGVAGIPRSGMIAASYLAAFLSVPLYEVSSAGLHRCGHGRRLDEDPGPEAAGPLVIVHDSVNQGTAMESIRGQAPENAIFATVYITPEAITLVDVYAVVVPMPHYFSWHFPGSDMVTSAAWDMDGVICEECPIPAYDDGPWYLEFLQNAKPLIVPRPHTVPLIVTARMERYRPQTEAWLRRHGVRWGRLVMGQWESLEERNSTYDAGEYKGKPYLESGLELFIESCPLQSQLIHDYTGKRVICPTTGAVFG